MPRTNEYHGPPGIIALNSRVEYQPGASNRLPEYAGDAGHVRGLAATQALVRFPDRTKHWIKLRKLVWVPRPHERRVIEKKLRAAHMRVRYEEKFALRELIREKRRIL